MRTFEQIHFFGQAFLCFKQVGCPGEYVIYYQTHFQFQCARNKRQFSFTTGLIEVRRAQQRVPWRWIFEIVLHTLCSYRWISRILMQSNSWRFVWIFEALLVRFSSNAITTSPFHRRTSLHQHSQQWGQKAQLQTLVKSSILIERTWNFGILNLTAKP